MWSQIEFFSYLHDHQSWTAVLYGKSWSDAHTQYRHNDVDVRSDDRPNHQVSVCNKVYILPELVNKIKQFYEIVLPKRFARASITKHRLKHLCAAQCKAAWALRLCTLFIECIGKWKGKKEQLHYACNRVRVHVYTNLCKLTIGSNIKYHNIWHVPIEVDIFNREKKNTVEEMLVCRFQFAERERARGKKKHALAHRHDRSENVRKCYTKLLANMRNEAWGSREINVIQN